MNNDLISRSALLEELRKGTIITDDLYGMGIMAGNDHAIKKIKAAPAVDAEKVFEAAGLAKEAFDMAKSSLVPVVRCEKCALWDHEHIEMYQHSTEHPELQARFAECGKWSTWSTCFMTRSDDYCSEAKRRSGDAD